MSVAGMCHLCHLMRHESCQESVQDTINHAFPTSTMLAVAHRLETIMEFLGHQVMMLL